MALAALVGSLFLTGLLRRLAIRFDFIDRPGSHKTHTKPIALGGGIVIFWLTMLPPAIVAALALWWNKVGVPDIVPFAIENHIPGLAAKAAPLFVLIASAAVLHIMGLIDDRKGLGALLKLVVQIAVAIALVFWGEIRLSFFIPSETIASVISVLWIVVIVNAFNFLDNMDGLSAGIAIICSAVILPAAIGNGQVFVAAFVAILIAVLLGFLAYNFAPAKIFMGDSGSLVVGLLIAVAAVRTTYHDQSIAGSQWYAALMPLLVLAVPLYDFTSVVIIRLLQGRSPFIGDRQHFSHRLLQRGMSQRQAVLTIYLATACTGLGATFLHQLSTAGTIMVFAQTVMIVLIIAILERPGTNSGSQDSHG